MEKEAPKAPKGIGMKLWEKGYRMDKEAEDYMVGNGYILDQALVKYDCRASIAHAEMLGKIGILSSAEVKALVKVLNEIIKLDSKGKFIIEKQQEDSHTAIENYLTEKLGSTGKKIHTARSRNDQVQAALRLYYKDELKKTKELTKKLVLSLKAFSGKYGSIEIPGYTHMRKAMPSSIRLWSAAFIEALEDDLKLLGLAYELVDQSPLGTGAGYGLPIAVDRAYVAKKLNFSKIQGNPIYVQNSRGKFESTRVHALSQIMFDLNKMAQDLILFSMPEFGYFMIPKEFTTGSSIMPQKKNPDVLELVRANYHVVNSYEFRIKEIAGNLISGYNADFSLTKEPVMQGFSISEKSISIMSHLVKKLKVDKERCAEAMSDELYATEKAYKLVKQGKPFRDAYKTVSKEYADRK
jgi:argininosuccinate lyase